MRDRFKLLVFDWDGTLMDSEARIVACLRGAIGDCGLESRATSELRDIIGLGLREALARLYPKADDAMLEQLKERYRHHFLHVDETPSPLFPGVSALLQELDRSGVFLAVATGKGRVGLNKALAQSQLDGVFHVTRCADETASKPNPQMLLEVMDAVGVYPDQTLMVGDTEYDMLMARNAGTAALAVSYGVHSRERLLPHAPLACVDSVAQLQRWLWSEQGEKVSSLGVG